MRPSSESLYQFAPINDGLLYTETPNFYPGQPSGDLLTLLLQQRWRGEAHFRAACGYVPYSGGGIAFYAAPLILRGVKPLWWPAPGADYEEALEALLTETPFFKDERDAIRHHDNRWDPAKKECEWVAKKGLGFSIDDIAYIWIGPQSLRKHSPEKMIAELREFTPAHIPIYLEAPEREPYPSFWVRGNPLDVSDYQRKVRIENRVTFVITMDPEDFLRLTGAGISREDYLQEAETLEAYNQWTQQGEIRIAPYLTLEVDPKNPIFGRIIGHEGRHRMAALINKGETLAEIGIELVYGNSKEWDKQPICFCSHSGGQDGQHCTSRWGGTGLGYCNKCNCELFRWAASFADCPVFWAPQASKPGAPRLDARNIIIDVIEANIQQRSRAIRNVAIPHEQVVRMLSQKLEA